MFDKTITLKSTNGAVLLHITAGTEGVKSLMLEEPPAAPYAVTKEALMDYLAEALKKS